MSAGGGGASSSGVDYSPTIRLGRSISNLYKASQIECRLSLGNSGINFISIGRHLTREPAG